mgnify:CR=1 FL=1
MPLNLPSPNQARTGAMAFNQSLDVLGRIIDRNATFDQKKIACHTDLAAVYADFFTG